MIEDRVGKSQEFVAIEDISSENLAEEIKLANQALAAVGLRAERFHFHPKYVDAVNLRFLNQEDRSKT